MLLKGYKLQRLTAQERAVQRAARNIGRAVAVVWLYGDGMRVKVQARPKLLGFTMRYWIGPTPWPRKQLCQALWNCGADGIHRP